MQSSTVRAIRGPARLAAVAAMLACGLALTAPDASAVAALGVSRFVVAGGGGGPSTGGAYTLIGTAGQLAAGPLASMSFDLNAGFWGAHGAGTVAVGGPGPGSGDTRTWELHIFPAAPNPTRSLARIAFELPDERTVGVRVYDVNGRVVRDLASGSTSPGRHVLTWDTRTSAGRQVGAGMYFVRIDLGDLVRTQRLVVIR